MGTSVKRHNGRDNPTRKTDISQTGHMQSVWVHHFVIQAVSVLTLLSEWAFRSCSSVFIPVKLLSICKPNFKISQKFDVYRRRYDRRKHHPQERNCDIASVRPRFRQPKVPKEAVGR